MASDYGDEAGGKLLDWMLRIGQEAGAEAMARSARELSERLAGIRGTIAGGRAEPIAADGAPTYAKLSLEELSGLAQAQKLRIDLRGGMQGKRRGYTHVLGKVGNLAPHVVLGDIWTARIGSQAHGNTRIKCLACAFDDSLAHNVAVELLNLCRRRFLRIKQHKRQGRRDGTRERCGTPKELRSCRTEEKIAHFVGHGCAVLDSIHTRLQGDLYALSALDMRHNGEPKVVSRFARSSRHLERHAQNARLSRNLGVKDASCHEELDSVGTARGQIAYVVARLLRRCGHLGKKACTMTIGHGNARTRRHDARAKITSSVDSIAHSDIGIQRVTRTAHTRHTACKLLLGRAFKNMAHNHAAERMIQAAHEVAGVSRRHGSARAA